jgi:hypothetical protein
VSSVCTRAIDEQTLVDYWAGDLGAAEIDAIDEHLMGCATCSASSGRIAAISAALREQVPPVLRGGDLARLAARGMRIVENSFSPGERREVEFPAGVDLLVHRLVGLDLTHASRVSFTMSVESTAAVLGATDDAPFDRDAGAVLVACRPHYAFMPPDTVADISVHGADGSRRDYRYTLLHLFEPR